MNWLGLGAVPTSEVSLYEIIDGITRVGVKQAVFYYISHVVEDGYRWKLEEFGVCFPSYHVLGLHCALFRVMGDLRCSYGFVVRGGVIWSPFTVTVCDVGGRVPAVHGFGIFAGFLQGV